MAEEQSHREEMNAAIRAQRERQKAANPTPPPAPVAANVAARPAGGPPTRQVAFPR